MNTTNLEARIERLENIEAIKKLTALYSFHVNKGWNGKQVHVDIMPSIFADDARWESKRMKMTAVGLEQSMNTLRQATSTPLFSMHSYTNSIIEVESDQIDGQQLRQVAENLLLIPQSPVKIERDSL